MAIAPTEVRALAQQGAEALRRGDAKEARDVFQRLTEAGPGDAIAWLGLAFACRAQRDSEPMLAALDRVTALDPGNWRALLPKPDHFAEAGDARAVSSFCPAAIRRAPQPAQMPPELQGELNRARAMRERYINEYETYLHRHLARQGLGEGQSSRFVQSLDLLLGKKQLYVQQPRHYYFPELPQIQFYGREQFPWLDGLEAATADIRSELIEVLKDEGAFTPYIENDPNRPQQDHHGMLNNPSWSAVYLVKNGNVVAENAARCPQTLAAVEKAPLAQTKDRTPSILFSLLRPGARIPPQNGFINVRLICHLPLIVPGNCIFRVGNDVRPWVEGKAWVFDDTVEHEAWNGSDKTRVILLFDVWRPELSEEERRLVAGMFEAIDSYKGKQAEWDF